MIACADDSCGNRSELLDVELVGGRVYTILVDGYAGDTGAWNLDVSMR